MNAFSSLIRLTVLAALFVGSGVALAEVRAFTDSTGRTFRGELAAVVGDFVTIKREADGQSFTVKASGFSKPDVEYFMAHGWKPAVPNAPTANAAGTPAAVAPMRIETKVYSGKKETNSKSYYDKDQRLSYKIDVRNSESKRDLEKAKGTLLVFAKVLRYNDQTQLVGREEFDVDVKALGSFSYEMKKPIRLRYYSEGNYGLRASGYLVVIKDSTGKPVSIIGSSDTAAKNHEEALKLKLNDVFLKDYKFLQAGSTAYINE